MSPLHALKAIGFVLGLCLVTANVSAAMDVLEARHLLTRTGFGASAAQLREWGALDYQAAVTRLLAEANTHARTPPPAWVDDPPVPRKLKDLSEAERKAARTPAGTRVGT